MYDVKLRISLYCLIVALFQAGEWVEDHIGLQCNFFITLMQAEIDRYLDTLRLLKDYYKILSGTEGVYLTFVFEIRVYRFVKFALMFVLIPKAKCSTRWCGPSLTGCRCWRCQ